MNKKPQLSRRRSPSECRWSMAGAVSRLAGCERINDGLLQNTPAWAGWLIGMERGRQGTLGCPPILPN